MWFLWDMTSAQVAKNHGDKWGWIWYLRWGIFTSISTWTHLTKFSSSHRSTIFKDISRNFSQKLGNTIPICMRIDISCTMKRRVSFLGFNQSRGKRCAKLVDVINTYHIKYFYCGTITRRVANQSYRGFFYPRGNTDPAENQPTMSMTLG